MQPKRIAVAMSGGVDSSTTAALLKEQGHEVIGINMKLFVREGELPGTRSDARIVADYLGIPFHEVHFEEEFARLIISDFRDQYRCGSTPNPCVRCNRFVKFGLLLDKALELGADLLATGHYVRKTVTPDGLCHLVKACNLPKDQSYFLYTLNQEQLARVIFPLGEFPSKDAVRRRAAAYGLPVASKSDSQEICFIPNDDYIAFLEQDSDFLASPGEIVHLDGTTLGRHKGTHRYTIGQRRGLRIAWREPLYVTAIDAPGKRVMVAEQGHLLAPGLTATEVNWIIPPPSTSFETACKIRYRHQPVPCTVTIMADGGIEVRFHEPQKSVTPGQAVVFYQGEEVLGGGRIVAALAEE
jgi:tRNA-specific 2-thiouridylase